MANVDWHSNQPNCILIDFDKLWTWTEFDEAVKAAYDLMAGTESSIDLIVHHQMPMPAGNPLVHLRAAFRAKPDNLARIVTVCSERARREVPFAKALAQALDQAYGSRFTPTFVNSMSEAQAVLNDKQPDSES